MNPYLFEIGKIHIRWYTVFIMLGVIISLFMLNKEAKRFGDDGEFTTNLAFWTIIFGIIGARLYYVAFNWGYYSEHLSEIYKIWNGGIAIHGALLAGLLTIIIFCKHRHSKILLTLDIVSPCVLLAQALGRWGNFFNGEAFGSVTTLEYLKSLKIIPKFVIDGMYINGTYYLPMFYFESLYCLLGVIILLIIRRIKTIKNGQIFAFYLMWYSAGRFIIEQYRLDSLMLGSFKIAQIVSAVLFVIGFIIFARQMAKSPFEEVYNSDQTIENEIFVSESEEDDKNA